MFQRVDEARFIAGEHEILKFWKERGVFRKLIEQNRGKPKWSFLDGPITANNPMGVHHAWGRTYKDAYQRYFAMTGHELRYQNGFDCQGLWVEVEVEKELGLGTKTAIHQFGIDRFVRECKKRVLRFAARQTEQSIRLGYWMEWDDPEELRKLADAIGAASSTSSPTASAGPPLTTYTTARGQTVTGDPEEIAARLGNPDWGGSYFTFSTENNETIWLFLKKCFERGKIYRGHDVMPWSGRGGSAYSQMEVADGRRLTTHRSCFVRFPLLRERPGSRSQSPQPGQAAETATPDSGLSETPSPEYLLVWTTTPWTLTANVACAVNPDLEYVRLRAKRDGAVYYFAKENLDYKRLEREFKEGFGGDWIWPQDVPKLKTIAQIFKEQGGYEIEGTLKGSEMLGWRYAGPFDDLPAQQQAFGRPPAGKQGLGNSSDSRPSTLDHPVIDGGRDSKGNPNVVAGEGTGIVHIAPGCGDIDHKIGVELGLPIIAPLKEDGTYDEGFGEFTGREAIASQTAELVFEKLRQKGLLVHVETYPHIYPHCWRTGDELVFRLVDEWFINMDWRQEIQEVVRCIRWLPPAIQGEERELEWLASMRDWMISKKRFWGLALPIWVEEDDPTQFVVFGSLAELKQWYDTYGGEGWEAFAGHTPHRPWIDHVRLRNKSGRWMRRIEDVGNPWLDAGIVPFSTLNYRASRVEGSESTESGGNSAFRDSRPPSSAPPLRWRDWFPADFVVECFPGQFRNWFYSLLALATMMRFDETDDPCEKRPFKTLLGHRLVMDEHGNAMHKSDGTAIWFEEAAEQLGVDTLRWMYLAQNPAADLRFGLRRPDQPVTLETPDGPITQTKEGLPCCLVTSTPADEIRRQVLIPLWNSYAFFVNYAVLDGYTPDLNYGEAEARGLRTETDRWILSRLQELTQCARRSFEEFDVATFMRAAAEFIDDLSNWYIRRNRRRFWRARLPPAEGVGAAGAGAGISGRDDADKLIAYQTLYEVLVALSKLLAPAIPFLTERMYQNLVVRVAANRGEDAAPAPSPPESVHLCPYPEVDPSKLDPALNRRMAAAQRVVRLGHRLRETAGHRVRQPLEELRYDCRDETLAADVGLLEAVIADELNVKRVTRDRRLDELVAYQYKPNLKTLGPKYGKLLNALKTALPTIDPARLAPLRSGEEVTVTIDGHEVALAPEDVLISTVQATDWVSGAEGGVQAALCTKLTPELVAEGMARDFIRHVQQLRKEADLEENQRIVVRWSAGGEAAGAVESMLAAWATLIQTETRADAITRDGGAVGREVTVGDSTVRIAIVSG